VSQPPILVCFAVKEEARYFHARAGVSAVVITGMGRDNAAAGVRKALATVRPRLVITAGFAGGLNPELKTGTALFEADEGAGLRAAEKQVLWQLTGADAVEMESSVIRTICWEHKIPSATIRVISDAAAEDLPLDFNELMTRRHRINYAKLAGTLLRRPGKIPQLLRFQKQTVFAAQRLGEVLQQSLSIGAT